MSNKVPQIRFNGYSDDWVENQLGSLIKIERQQEIKKEKLTDTPEGYYVLAMRTFSKEGYIDFSKPYWIKSDIEDKDAFLLPGEFAIIDADMDVNLPKIGKVLINSYNKKFLLAAHVRKVNVQNNVNSYFMYGVMRTDQLLRRLKKEASGSIAQGLLDKNIYKQNVYIPAISEQAKIGLFLKEFENIITLHQRKLDLLKEQKKGFLQKMFPKNGAKVPELRFTGFADAWEQRKLSEIYDKIRNAFVGTATPYYVNQGHFYLESNNVKYGKLNFNNEVYINDDFYQKQKPNWLHTGDLVIVQSGHVGHSAVIPPELNNTAAHAVIIVAKPKQKIDPYFINDYLQTNIARKQIDNITTGNTIKHILASAMKMFEVSLPSYEEQRPISNLLAQIDDTITLHQRKLEKLQELKKGYLQKMFV